MTQAPNNVSESAESVDQGSRLIKLDGVTKTFANGSIIATSNINLNIRPEEFVVFLGPSGCGKTTTLRCIAGLEIPDSGRIMIGDEDITNQKPKDRDLAFVFQTIALFQHKNVRENMRFGLDMKSNLSLEDKNQRVEEAAQLLGIEGLLNRAPSELSGGQQQRVSLGRAMVMEPAAFLLDEPFSALDADLRNQMQTEVKRLHSELGRAMIFVTHDQDEAMAIGDKIVVMNDGEIQQVGAPYEIYNNPDNLFVAQFIGSPPLNTLECTIEKKDSGLYLINDLFSVRLTEGQSKKVNNHINAPVTMGIRPEYLILDGPEALVTANVDLVEPQGPRDTVFLQIENKEFRGNVSQGKINDSMYDVNVSLDIEHLWLFDKNGERLV